MREFALSKFARIGRMTVLCCVAVSMNLAAAEGAESTQSQSDAFAAIADPDHLKSLNAAVASSTGAEREAALRACFGFAKRVADSGGNWQTANRALHKLLEKIDTTSTLRMEIIDFL